MSLSFMRRDRDTPNGLTEFLVVRAIELLRERGIEELSLNFAAFARLIRAQGQSAPAPLVDARDPLLPDRAACTASTRSSTRAGSRATSSTRALSGCHASALAALLVEGQLPRLSFTRA